MTTTFNGWLATLKKKASKMEGRPDKVIISGDKDIAEGFAHFPKREESSTAHIVLIGEWDGVHGETCTGPPCFEGSLIYKQICKHRKTIKL